MERIKQLKAYKARLPYKCVAALLCMLLLLSFLACPVFAAATVPILKRTEQSSSGSDTATESDTQSDTQSEADSNADSSGDSSQPEPSPNPDDEEPEEKLFEVDYEVQARAAYLVNGETGVVVYEKNAEEALTSASLVKMMTSILVAERAESLDEESITAETWVFNQLYGLNASHADIRKGETLTLRELLYAMILPSGNEAALMAAYYISGGYMPNFLYMMNARAKSLGCTNTYFADPNGLSEENYTCAKDMYLIVQAFMANPVLAEIAGQANYEMAAHNHAKPYYISSTNRFLFSNDPYAKRYKTVAAAMLGGKTGGLGEWQNFACKAEKDDQTYYCVVLHSPFEADTVRPTMENAETQKPRPALVESAELLTWAFSSLEVRATIDTRQPVHEIPVRYSTERDAVRLLPVTDLRTVLPKDKDGSAISMRFDVPEYLEAPVTKGETVGTVTLYLAGAKLGTSELITEQDVARNETKYQVKSIQAFFTSTFLKTYITLIISVAVLYVLLIIYYNNKRKNKRKNARK